MNSEMAYSLIPSSPQPTIPYKTNDRRFIINGFQDWFQKKLLSVLIKCNTILVICWPILVFGTVDVIVMVTVAVFQY